jgi:hypothetical protein
MVNAALTPSQAVGNFNYQEAITTAVTGTVTISGNWAVDNCGTIAWGAGSGTAVSSGSGLTIAGGANASACTHEFERIAAVSFHYKYKPGFPF